MANIKTAVLTANTEAAVNINGMHTIITNRTGAALFEHCTLLVTAVWNTPHSIDNAVFNDCPALTTVIIKGGCGAIGQRAFYGAASLSKITIPPSVKLIGDYAFYGCTSLNSVTIARDCVLNGSPFPTNCTINYYD